MVGPDNPTGGSGPGRPDFAAVDADVFRALRQPSTERVITEIPRPGPGFCWPVEVSR
jgi:hypothetical protein